MEYKSVSAKLSREEITLLRLFCEKKGTTPSSLIRELILRELKVPIPQTVAGKNKIHYDKERDLFTWSIELDNNGIVEVLKNVSPAFLENLDDIIKAALDERAIFMGKKKKDSVPIPSSIIRGRKMTDEELPQESVYINCDGASRGNPGNAAIGVCIKGADKKTVLKEYGEFIGQATNNVAEYRAVIKALDLAREFTNKSVFIFSDSELRVKQLKGEYKVRNLGLKKLFSEVKKLEGLYQKVDYFHVGRERNEVADKLANDALDEVLKDD